MRPLSVLNPSRLPTLTRLVALGAALLMLSALPVGASNPEQARIAQTRAELEAVRAELDNVREEAGDDLIALEDADRQLEAAFDAVDSASRAVSRQEDAVRDAEHRLAQAREELIAQRELMGDRVSRMYRHARPDPLISVLDAASVGDAVRQSAYMSAIGREDRAAVEGLANAETTVAAEERALEAEQVAMTAVLQEQEALLAEVEEIRNDRALVAAASQDLVARLQAREDHLESEVAELQELVRRREAELAAAAAAAEAAAQAQAEAAAAATTTTTGGSGSSGSGSGQTGGAAPAPAPAPPPPPSGGGFAWPTSGTVTSEFGPRWGRNHNGIDIANGSGTAVAAARGGTVVVAGSQGGYGNTVVIAHGNGFRTLYAHLSSIAVSNGQSVSTGTFLGGMGCTGSCTGTHLHFEIHANGTPVNPRNYL